MALFFREELTQRKLFFDANRAARNGQLELSEGKLEQLLDTSPDFEDAASLLLQVSSELVLPALPLELSAKHDHRLGSCTGRLTLHDWGIEYPSRSHGTWRWRFEHTRAIYNRGSWRVTVETYEDDMLGLLDAKNYNFSLLGEPLDEQLWKRYQRLFRYRREQRESSRP